MAHGDTDVPAGPQEAPAQDRSMRLRTDSGARANNRGVAGIEKLFTALAPCQLKLGFDRTRLPTPWGILGGDGARPDVAIERGQAEIRFRPSARARRPGAVKTGGGSDGDPQARSARVERGHALISVSRRKRSSYGVALDDSGGARSETARLRRLTGELSAAAFPRSRRNPVNAGIDAARSSRWRQRIALCGLVKRLFPLRGRRIGAAILRRGIGRIHRPK
jgi:hypothetical protein